jgi:hypothetical protein
LHSKSRSSLAAFSLAASKQASSKFLENSLLIFLSFLSLNKHQVSDAITTANKNMAA